MDKKNKFSNLIGKSWNEICKAFDDIGYCYCTCELKNWSWSLPPTEQKYITIDYEDSLYELAFMDEICTVVARFEYKECWAKDGNKD